MAYSDNHVSIDQGKSWITTKGKRKSWECFLAGETIGAVEWAEKRADWEKAYEAKAYYVDGKEHRRKSVGWYDTLYAARNALLEPGREYIRSIHTSTNDSRLPAAHLTLLDAEFYPTPPEVAGKMLAGVDWDKVKTILEPSAGKGDLLEYAMKMNQSAFRRKGDYFFRLDEHFDADCIELDDNLRALLIGKGYRVVHDDFLTYHTRKRYDLVLMNPPFSKGDLHLLHALELCENGGQIACVLNAETIRNPYTNSRKTLLKKLRQHGARIRYLFNGFAHAARKTNVEVAIVNITIPTANPSSTIWEGLKQAQECKSDCCGSTNAVAPASAVERLIREYDLLCVAGIELMNVYSGIAPYIKNGKGEYARPIIALKISGQTVDSVCTSHDINRFVTKARARYWEELFDLPELRERMTSAMQDQYRSTIQKMCNYEFSEFNVRQVLAKIMKQLETGVENAIEKCFDKLSAEHAYHDGLLNDNIHYYNGWKTNKAHYVNMKCIIPTWGCFASHYKQDKHGRYKSVLEGLDERGCFEVLDDLEKALDYLDKGETPRTNLGMTLRVAAERGRTSGIRCKYFEVTFYKKGTCHIRFYNPRIVDRLNIYVGRKHMWLPPSYGKVRYEDMDDESRRVVNEYMGREHYERVMEHPNDYIIEAGNISLLMSGGGAI